MTEHLSARDCIDFGVSAFHRNNEEEASKYFTKALEIDATAYEAMNHLGILALHLGNGDLAEEWWLKSIDVEESAEANSNLGFYYSKNEELQKAKPYLKKAVQLNPNQLDAIIQWAFIELTEGNFGLTEELLAPLLDHDVAFEEAHVMLSQAKIDQKQFDQAVETLERLIQKVPSSAQAHHQLAKTHWTTNNFEASARSYHQVLQIVPFNIDIVKEYSILLRDHLSRETSIELLQNTLTWAGNDWEVHWLLGTSQELIQQDEEALKSYSHAMALNPTEAGIRQKVAYMKEKLVNNQ